MENPSFEQLIAVVLNKRRGVKKRSAAIGGLIMLNDPRALEPLIGLFTQKKDHPNVRAQVANAIGRIGLGSLEDVGVIHMLLAALQDPTEHEVVRAQAAWALGQLYTPLAVDTLIDALGDTSSQVRYWSAAGLRLLGDKRALNPLIALLQDHSSDVRSITASALAQIGDRSDEQVPQATRLLVDLLSDESAHVRRSALEALGKLGGTEVLRHIGSALLDKGREAEGFEEVRVRWEAAKAMGELGGLANTDPASLDAVDALLIVFNDRTEDQYLRSLAMRSLGSFGANDLLIRALLDQSEEHSVRANAAHTLARVGHVESVQVLLSVLTNRAEPKTVRTASALGIMQLKAKGAAGPVTSIVLDASEDDLVRYYAVLVLGALREPSTVDPLLLALKQIDGERAGGEPGGGQRLHLSLFTAVIGALGELGDARAVQPLIDLARSGGADANPDTRSITLAALSALGTLGDRQAVEPILALLEGYDNDVDLLFAMRALGELGDKRAVAPLIRVLGRANGSSSRSMAALMLGELGDARAVEPLIEALEDTSVRVRIAAVDALGKLGDARALAVLKRLQIQDEGETVEGHTVKEAASEAMEQISTHLLRASAAAESGGF
jgi:HEAT repeat protein